MNFNCECSKCKNIIALNGFLIKEKKIKVHRYDKEVYLTYWICPKCGEVHTVQIDNDDTKILLDKERTNVLKAYNCRKKCKSVSKKLKKEHERISKDLREMRRSLIELYNGERYLEEGQLKEIKVEVYS